MQRVRTRGKRKEKRYPELQGARCRVVVTAMKVGGHWSEEARNFLEELAAARALDAPRILQKSASQHWKKRWSAFLTVAGMRAFADTLLYGTASHTEIHEGSGPELGQLLGLEPHGEAPENSRLPLRA